MARKKRGCDLRVNEYEYRVDFIRDAVKRELERRERQPKRKKAHK